MILTAAAWERRGGWPVLAVTFDDGRAALVGSSQKPAVLRQGFVSLDSADGDLWMFDLPEVTLKDEAGADVRVDGLYFSQQLATLAISFMQAVRDGKFEPRAIAL